MGGIITFLTLNRRPEFFHSVLFAGVPFASGVGFMEDLHVGSANGYNKKILNPQVLATFASYHFFWPTLEDLERDNLNQSKIVDSIDQTLVWDLYDVETWKDNKLGIFSFEEPVSQELEEHIKKALIIGKRIRSELIAKEEIRYPPIGVLNSLVKDTLSCIIKDGPKSVRGYDFKSYKKEKGDGRMRYFESLPPNDIPVHKVWICDQSHGHLLDAENMTEILSELIREAEYTIRDIVQKLNESLLV